MLMKSTTYKHSTVRSSSPLVYQSNIVYNLGPSREGGEAECRAFLKGLVSKANPLSVVSGARRRVVEEVLRPTAFHAVRFDAATPFLHDVN
jgi:hypothetical protein